MKYRYSIFFLLMLVIGCTDKPEPNTEEICVTYPIGGDYESRAYNFSTPCFNPANGDEFIYVRFKNNYPDAKDYELRKHTISTGYDALIQNVSESIYYISMDKNGWIFYNDHNFCIWKIRTDGSGLSQVSFTSMFHYSVCPNGQYVVADKLNTSVYQTIVIDNNGVFLDTLHYSYPISKSWLNDTLLLLICPLDFSMADNLTQWKLISYPNKKVFSTGALPYFSQMVEAVNINQILYSDGNLSVFDIGNGTYTPLRTNCGNKYIYMGFSYSRLSGKVLLQQQKTELVDSTISRYRLTDDIVLMNLDGTGEKILSLPQTP